MGRAGGEGAPPEGDRGVGLGQMREALQPGERRTGSGSGLSGVMAEGELRPSGGGGANLGMGRKSRDPQEAEHPD